MIPLHQRHYLKITFFKIKFVWLQDPKCRTKVGLLTIKRSETVRCPQMSYGDHRCSQVVTDTQRKVKNRSVRGVCETPSGFRKRVIWRRQARSIAFRKKSLGFRTFGCDTSRWFSITVFGVPNFLTGLQYHGFWRKWKRSKPFGLKSLGFRRGSEGFRTRKLRHEPLASMSFDNLVEIRETTCH